MSRPNIKRLLAVGKVVTRQILGLPNDWRAPGGQPGAWTIAPGDNCPSISSLGEPCQAWAALCQGWAAPLSAVILQSRSGRQEGSLGRCGAQPSERWLSSQGRRWQTHDGQGLFDVVRRGPTICGPVDSWHCLCRARLQRGRAGAAGASGWHADGGTDRMGTGGEVGSAH